MREYKITHTHTHTHTHIQIPHPSTHPLTHIRTHTQYQLRSECDQRRLLFIVEALQHSVNYAWKQSVSQYTNKKRKKKDMKKFKSFQESHQEWKRTNGPTITELCEQYSRDQSNTETAEDDGADLDEFPSVADAVEQKLTEDVCVCE